MKYYDITESALDLGLSYFFSCRQISSDVIPSEKSTEGYFNREKECRFFADRGNQDIFMQKILIYILCRKD